MKFIRLFLFLILIRGMFSCANRASGPTGGPRDSIPPVVIRSVPENGAVNFRKKEISVYFNENITLEKINEHLVVSPPQKTQPIAKANAKHLSFKFEDELQDSTTYSILFGDAIVDLNEKNPLKNYVFSFATGDEIDTLQISGTLLYAENLNPVKGTLVGLHENLEDSAILKNQFVRVAKTNDEGRFVISNVKEGQYKVYALTDLNRDFMYQPGEEVAFFDSIIIPEVKTIQHADTIWKDSLTIDTIHSQQIIKYYPDDLLLKHFKERKKRQYLLRAERNDDRYFQLIFNDKQDSLPKITPLNFDLNTKFLLQTNLTKDTLVYWMNDSIVYHQDTLSIQLDYLKSDSIFQLVPQTDTIHLSVRRQRPSGRSRGAKTDEDKLPALNIKTNLSNTFDVYRSVFIESEEPLALFDKEKIHLQILVDSIYESLDFELETADSIQRSFNLHHKWEPEAKYRFELDSAACISIYGKASNAIKTDFKIPSLDDYSTLKIVLENYDSLAIIQVLDPKETIIQAKPADPSGTTFEHLKPGDYFVRLFLDVNQNGVWDTGDLEQRIQPEEIIYFNMKLSLRSNWELEEKWNHLDETFFNKKPEDLVKDKRK